jgi:hypothetical protein
MDHGIAIHLAGGGLEDPGLYALGESKHVDRPNYTRLRRLDWVELVVYRGGRAGEVIDFIHLDI